MPTTTIQHKRDTAAIWAASGRILATGQIGVETDTGKFKIGDGTNVWSALAYRGGPTSPYSLTLFDDTTAGAWLTTLGVTAAAQTLLALSGVVGVQIASQQALTNADLGAFPTTPVAIAAPADPGAGFVVLPYAAWIRVNATAGVYTNINAACRLIVESSAGASALNELDQAVSTQVGDLLAVADSNAAVLGLSRGVSTLANYESQGLTILANNSGSGDFTGGNAANSGSVKIIWSLLPI